MITLPVQFDRHTGPNVVGEHKLIFSIDESIEWGHFNPVKIKKGTQFMMILLNLGEKNNEKISNEGLKKDETEEDTKKRLQKRLHSLIGDWAELAGKKKEEVKSELRSHLISENKIKFTYSFHLV